MACLEPVEVCHTGVKDCRFSQEVRQGTFCNILRDGNAARLSKLVHDLLTFKAQLFSDLLFVVLQLRKLSLYQL